MVGRFRPEERPMSKSVSLLISILVRYPEVGSLHYDPRSQELRFTFLLTRILPEREYEALRRRLQESLEAFSFLDGRPMRQCYVERTSLDELTMIEIRRDVDTLTQEEIALVMELMLQEFPHQLVVDPGASLYEDELAMQEELIEQMLEDLRDSRGDRRLVAFREEGRVMVFNQ